MSGHAVVGVSGSPPDAALVDDLTMEGDAVTGLACSRAPTSGYRWCQPGPAESETSLSVPWTPDELRAAMAAHPGHRLAGPFVTTVRATVGTRVGTNAGTGAGTTTDEVVATRFLVRSERDLHTRPGGRERGETDAGPDGERVVVERVIGTDGPWWLIDVVAVRSDLATALEDLGDGALGAPTPLVVERTTWVVHDGDGTADAEFTSDVSTNLLTGTEHHDLFVIGRTDPGKIVAGLVTARRVQPTDRSPATTTESAITSEAATTTESATATETAMPPPVAAPAEDRPENPLFDALVAAVTAVERATNSPEWSPTRKALRSLSESLGMLAGASLVLGTDAELTDSLDRLHRHVLNVQAISDFVRSAPELRSAQSRTVGSTIREHLAIERFHEAATDRLDRVRDGVGEHLRAVLELPVSERLSWLPSLLFARPFAPGQSRELLLGAGGASRKGTRDEHSRAARRVLQQALFLSVVADAKKTRVAADGLVKATRGVIFEECRQRMLRDLADGTTAGSRGDAVSESPSARIAERVPGPAAERSLLLVIGAHAELSARRHRKHRRELTERLDRFPTADAAAR